MLKTLLPMALLTAMLPSPCRATIMDAKTLGKEVPAAEMVRPATVSLMPMVCARASTLMDMTKESTASQSTHETMDVMYQLRRHLWRTSGTLTQSRNLRGSSDTCTTTARKLASLPGHSMSSPCSSSKSSSES